MKKILVFLLTILSIGAYAQSGSPAYGSVFMRVTDSVAYVNNSQLITRHSQGYADIWYSEASELWWKWNGAAYELLYATPSAGGVTTMAAIGSSANANGATISGSTLNLEPASASFGGVLTTGTQTIAGDKTFSSASFTATETNDVNLSANDDIILTTNTGGLSPDISLSSARNITLTGGNDGSGTISLTSNGNLSITSAVATSDILIDADDVLNFVATTFQLNSAAASTPTTMFFRADGTWSLLPVRALNTETTQTGNVGTGEDNLFSYSIPGATLATNGNSIKARFSGTFAANGNSKTLKVKFGATTIVSTAGAYQQKWVVDCEIIRTGATTQKCNCTVVGSDPGITHSTYFTAAETLSSAVDLLVTGEATSDNDIVKETAKVKLEE